LLIGTTTEGHADGDNFTIAGSGNTGMTIRSTNSQKSTIYFSDSTSGAGEYSGYIHYDHSGNNLNIGVNENERMRIDSSGHVLINNTAYSANGTLVVQQTADSKGIAIIDSGVANTFFLENDGTINKIRNNSGVPIAFETNSTERMRIDSSGRVMVGTTSYISTAGFNPLLSVQSAANVAVFKATTGSAVTGFQSGGTTNAQNFCVFLNGNGSAIGSIQVSNGTSGSATSYNTSSDYRLKTDVQPMTGASERVQALNPVNFEWIASGDRVDGFLAHEAATVVPESVTGTKDEVDDDGNAVMQGIDQSKIVPLLTAALQEALTEITALKARVTTLEGA
jgi:hypothetical protein